MMAKVLVVEDEALVRLLLVESLESAGHEVIEAPDGLAALAVLEQMSDLEAVVTDIRMPRLDGYGLALAARRLRPHIRLVFMTGYTDNAAPEELRDVQVLQKPFDPERIVATVETLMK
jgi:CheY-like chemotaxis protein